MTNDNNTQETLVDTVVDTNTEVETTTTENGVENTETNPTETPRTFTQEEVNDIVRERLSKSKKVLYTKYGVEDADGLDELVGKAQSYEVLTERIEELRKTNASQTEELAFLKNNIEPSRYDDIRAYFKGKGLEFNAETLVQELSTHPEWVRPEVKSEVTTIKVMGATQHNGNPQKTDAEIVGDLFGIRL